MILNFSLCVSVCIDAHVFIYMNVWVTKIIKYYKMVNYGQISYFKVSIDGF